MLIKPYNMTNQLSVPQSKDICNNDDIHETWSTWIFLLKFSTFSFLNVSYQRGHFFSSYTILVLSIGQ